MNTCTTCGHSVATDQRSCDRCGAAMTAAGGGLPNAAPPAPPQPLWQAAPPPPAPAAPPWAQPTSAPDQPFASTPVETTPGEFGQPEPSRRNRGVMIALLTVGALIIAAVAVLAVRAFTGSDRGEAEPDAAVDTMIAAIADENPVDLVNSIAPSELALLGDVERAAADAVDGDGEVADSLEEQGITIDGEDLIPGLTLEIADLTYDVEEKSESVAKVNIDTISGDWSFDPKVLLESVNLDELTNGQVSEDEALEEIEDADVSSGSFDIDDLDFSEEGVFLMAVREDGGWFVSALYTLLEYVTQINDLPEGDFAELEVEGAATPQEAVERSARAFFAFALEGDFTAVIDSLPPSRYAALYAYREALEELASREGIDDAEKLDIDVQVEEISEFDDERGVGVTIERASIEMTAEGSDDTIRFEIDGKCASNTRIEDGDEDSQEFCLDDFGEGAGPFEDGIPGIDRFWVIVTEEDGEFFVDPVASIGSYIAAADMQQIADDVSEMLTPVDDDDGDGDSDSSTEPVDVDTTDAG